MTALPTTSSTPSTTESTRRDVPVLAFRIVAAICIGFVLTGPGGARSLLSPWVAGSATHFEMHRWHATDIAALVALLAVGALGVCALAPRRYVVAGQAFLAAVASLGVLSLTMPDPAAALVPCIALAVLFLASYPRRRALLHWQGGDDRDRLAVVAAVVSTPFLLVNSWGNLSNQLANVSEHATFGHWAGAAALAVALLVVGWLVAAGGSGTRALAVVLGVTWLYLGVAALALPHHDGSWGVAGAIVALVTGVLFLAVPLVTRRTTDIAA